jgi:hypothetical protein
MSTWKQNNKERRILILFFIWEKRIEQGLRQQIDIDALEKN